MRRATPVGPALRAAVHVGRREHYQLARDLIAGGPQRAVLMQRSSTLLLGPERGWDHEAAFHDEAWRSVERGTRWFHIASLVGIERHLERRGSSFPLVQAAGPDAAWPHVVAHDGIVTIRGSHGQTAQPVKVLPDEDGLTCGDDFRTDDFKFDRQARLVAADYGDHCEALVVSDVGDQQVTVHLDGPPAAVLIEVCVEFYERCPSLTTDHLARCLRRAASNCSEAAL